MCVIPWYCVDTCEGEPIGQSEITIEEMFIEECSIRVGEIEWFKLLQINQSEEFESDGGFYGEHAVCRI